MQFFYSLLAVLAFTASYSAAYADMTDVTQNQQKGGEKARADADKYLRSIESAPKNPKNPKPGESLQQYGIRQVEAAMAMQNSLQQQQNQQNLQKQQKIKNMIQQLQASGGQH